MAALGGARRGIFGAAIFYALGHGNLVGTPAGWVSAKLGSLLISAALGYTRFVSGPLLAPILLSMGVAGAGLLATQLEERLPIPGFNAPGGHTPALWLLPAAVSVALGLALLVREERRGGGSERPPLGHEKIAPWASNAGRSEIAP